MDPGEAYRVCCFHFPAGGLTATWVIGNLVVNNQGFCSTGQRGMMVAVIVLFSLFIALSRLTDSYVASDGLTYPIVLVPFYGAVCPHLPTMGDKDEVYARYRLRFGDFWRGVASAGALIVISVLCQPINACLFPAAHKKQPLNNGTSSMENNVVAAGPVFVVLIVSVLFMCLPPDRQMLGHVNVPPTVLPTADPVLQALNPTFQDMEVVKAGGSEEEGAADGRDSGGQRPVGAKGASFVDKDRAAGAGAKPAAGLQRGGSGASSQQGLQQDSRGARMYENSNDGPIGSRSGR